MTQPRTRAAITAGVIGALSRLNSYVRSNAYQRFYPTNLKHVVYRYKTALLVEGVKAGLAESRLIMVRAKCHTCGGRGYYGFNEGNTCWTCQGAGWVGLQFVESSLPGGFAFHTPYGTRYSVPIELQMTIKGQQPTWVSDWQPNQTGADLAPAALAEDLNAVEDWFYGDQFPTGYVVDARETTLDDVWYRLPIGKTETCVWCGAPGETLVTQLTLLTIWIEGLCGKCRHKHPFEVSPRPDQLLAPASVQTWLAKRAAWREIADTRSPGW
jgi:hypothetical protein